jgi:hypothetical protein
MLLLDKQTAGCPRMTPKSAYAQQQRQFARCVMLDAFSIRMSSGSDGLHTVHGSHCQRACEFWASRMLIYHVCLDLPWLQVPEMSDQRPVLWQVVVGDPMQPGLQTPLQTMFTGQLAGQVNTPNAGFTGVLLQPAQRQSRRGNPRALVEWL